MLVEVMIGRVCERDKEKERVRMDGWMDGCRSYGLSIKMKHNNVLSCSCT